MPDADALADAVRRGVEALRRGDPAGAADLLGPVARDTDLAAAEDLIDVRARVLVLYAQAVVAAERHDEIQPALVEALRLVKRLDDDDGVAAVRQLQQAASALRKKKLGPAAAPKPAAANDAEALLAAANAATGEDAAKLGERALELAITRGSVREEVLARLVIARARPAAAEAQLQAALRRARGANEFTLVGAVAKAAELAGVPLPQEPYGGRPT